MTGQTLKQTRLSRPDAQMMKLNLPLRPGERRGALVGGGVAMLVDAIEQGGARFGRHRPERDADCGARRNIDAAAQGENRIEHGADRIGQGPRVPHRKRRADAVPPAEEARPVGFELGLADGFAVGDAQMRGPYFRLRRRSLSSRGEDRARVDEIFGFDEQLREGGMSDIGALRTESEFGIGGDLDFARAAARVGDRDPTHLGVVLLGNEHFEDRRQGSVAPRDLRALLVEMDRNIRRVRRPSVDSPQTRRRRCACRGERYRSRNRRRWRPRANG